MSIYDSLFLSTSLFLTRFKYASYFFLLFGRVYKRDRAYNADDPGEHVLFRFNLPGDICKNEAA